MSLIIRFNLVAYHKYVEKFLHLSYEDQLRGQDNLLKALFSSLGENKYYGQFLGNDLKDFPIISKNDIWKYRGLIKNGVGLTEIHTSGSSGVKGVTYLSHRELMTNRALQLLWWEWAGYKIGAKTIQFGVGVKRSHIKKLKDLILRIDYLKAFNQTDVDLSKQLDRYKNRKLNLLGGYASSLFLMTETAENLNLNVKFEGVISWGDKLFDHYRQNIERVFDTKVYNTYGSSEGFNIAAECNYGRMHIMMHHVKVEVIDDLGNLLPTGRLGHCVVTRLDAFSFPFVRYKLGDLIELGSGPKECECGRNTDYIEKIVGRDTDIIRFDGGVLTVQIAVYFLKQFEEIDSWQIEYKDFEFIKIKIIYNSKLVDIQSIVNIFTEYVQNNLKVTVVEVNRLIKSGSGKPLLFVRVNE